MTSVAMFLTSQRGISLESPTFLNGINSHQARGIRAALSLWRPGVRSAYSRFYRDLEVEAEDREEGEEGGAGGRGGKT